MVLPPYSKQVENTSSVGKKFFIILDECLPKSHLIYSIINRNKIKMGYRTMPNFGRIIKSISKKVMERYVMEINIKKMRN